MELSQRKDTKLWVGAMSREWVPIRRGRVPSRGSRIVPTAQPDGWRLFVFLIQKSTSIHLYTL